MVIFTERFMGLYRGTKLYPILKVQLFGTTTVFPTSKVNRGVFQSSNGSIALEIIVNLLHLRKTFHCPMDQINLRSSHYTTHLLLRCSLPGAWVLPRSDCLRACRAVLVDLGYCFKGGHTAIHARGS